MIKLEINKMTVIELIELKRDKERALYSLGFKLAPLQLFDTIVELEQELEKRGITV